MRNKARFEYVDQFRKINCLQKLLPVDNLHPDDEDEVKQDNNKFIRYKDEYLLEDEPRNQDFLYNPIISSYKVDIEPDCHAQFNNNSISITNDIEYFQHWSETLNQEIRQRDYKHKFYFKHANPPPRLKEQPTLKEKSVGGGTIDEPIPQRNDHQDTNIDLPQRGKYNFQEISKHYLNSSREEDKDTVFLRDLTIKNEIAELRKLKNLDQIERIGDFQEQFNKFSYYIEPPPQQTEIEFIDNSIVRGNNTLAIDYFRDIGTPSRRILDYTINKEKRMRREDEQDLIADYRQENRELLYLYFLKEEELKINKSEMTFADMANIAMGRITSNNAHMCVRNEKVTKAQYTKLLKKMEKYDLRENEAGKPKEDRQVGTQELEEMAQNQNGDADTETREDKINIEKAIDEINKIRKQVKTLQDQGSFNTFDKSNFNNEVYIKLQKLLTVLYDVITEKMPQKYPLSQIGQHLNEISGKNDLGFDRLRILWFVANCYDEMMNKQAKTVDLRTIANKNPTDPKVTRYKGNKMLNQSPIHTKKVFGFNPRKKQLKMTEQNRSKSPIGFGKMTPTNRTRNPIKSDLNRSAMTNRTPTKQTVTASKLNISQQSTTARKYPMTTKR